MSSTTPDARAVAARDFALSALRLADASFAPASADASFRRYFRVEAQGRSWVVMDAPPEREDCRPFVHVTGLMHAAGLNAPQVIAQDLDRGYLLLSDLGRQTFLHVLDEGNADSLMQGAIAALVAWQRSSVEGALPPYDEALLRRELALFPEWYVGRHLGRALTAGQQAIWAQVCDALVQRALAQAKVFVHRDYMPRNLMVSDPNPGVLDYQDAVHGPIGYDVVSLFKDAFLSWPEARVEGWRADYHRAAQAAGLPVPVDAAEFAKDFDWMGAQRHLKVIGIFARIAHRDGKPHYLADVPRFAAYLRPVAARYPELAGLTTLLDAFGT